MKRIFSLILSLLIMISMMPVGNVYAATYPPENHTLPAGGTLDVSKISSGKLTPVIYNLDQNGATYTITGQCTWSTCLRIVVSANCTIKLDSTTINAGITYNDNTDKIYSGGVDAHGVFEIKSDKTVDFQMAGVNRIYPQNYNAYQDSLLGILMDVSSKVSFSGTGSLNLGGRIGQKIYIYLKIGRECLVMLK